MAPSANGLWNRRRYLTLLKACYQASSSAAKGKTLEDFVAYALGSLNGLSVGHRNLRTGSEELDILFWNHQRCDYFKTAGPEILVECKNWTSRVGSAEVDSFIGKMRRRTITHGILIARHGVTGEARDGRDGAIDILFNALGQGLRPLVLSLDDMYPLASPDDLVQLCIDKALLLMGKKL